MVQEEFSKFVTPLILNQFPDFISFCSTKPGGVVEINYPSNKGKLNLWFSTQSNGITIGLADGRLNCWHTHMELMGANTTDEEIEAAISLISKIIEDKILIVYSSKLGYFLSDSIEDVYEYQLRDELVDFYYWSQL